MYANAVPFVSTELSLFNTENKPPSELFPILIELLELDSLHFAVKRKNEYDVFEMTVMDSSPEKVCNSCHGLLTELNSLFVA